jgi:hypothetical protein
MDESDGWYHVIGIYPLRLVTNLCLSLMLFVEENEPSPSIIKTNLFLISNFHLVLNVVCFVLGNSPASEFYIPTFRNTLFHLHRRVGVGRLSHSKPIRL